MKVVANLIANPSLTERNLAVRRRGTYYYNILYIVRFLVHYYIICAIVIKPQLSYV